MSNLSQTSGNLLLEYAKSHDKGEDNAIFMSIIQNDEAFNASVNFLVGVWAGGLWDHGVTWPMVPVLMNLRQNAPIDGNETVS